MFEKSQGRYLLIIVLLIILTSLTPIYFGPGLSDPEPIGKFLNGTFSGITSDKKPYVTAYQNLTFNSPINFTTVPSQSRIIVGQRDGKVYWFDDDENTIDKNLLLDLSDEVGVVWDGGFLGLSIHPSFGASGSNYFYIYYTTKSSDTTLNSPLGFSCGLERFHGNYLHLERFEVDPLNMSFISDSRLTMVKMRMYNTTHRGGGMEFGDDGYLYLSTGDQAAYKNAQDISNNLDGGVLRLDVDENIFKSHAPIRKLGIDAGENDEFSGVGYMIPNSNPFNNSDGTVFEEYFSIGHRNPHRLTKDKITGKFYIGEIGENTHDEINVLSGGGNYGWPLYEGNDSFNSNCISSLYNNMLHKRPLTEFPRHDSNSLIGGYVYRGSNMPNLVGKYICADYGIGDEIWSVDVDTGQYEILGNFIPENIISFGQDYQGELYMLKLGDNVNLYKLEYANVDMNNVPQLLSETGVFKDLEKLVVNEGIIPFSLIDPFWSDGAYKKRWMVIPNDGTHDLPEEQISFSENGIWEFPKGAVLIKHFDYPIDDRNPNITRKVETRFSIKGEDDNFYFLTYNWNAEQTDAILQKVGIDEPIQITTENGNSRQINWHFPSNTECLSCHNSASKGTLGTRTRFLNNNFDYSSHIPEGVVANQLVTLSNLGILDTTILDEDTSSFFTHTSINNLSASVQDRARSYLDLNCAYCHQPETGNRANFDLRAINSLAQTGLLTAGANQQLTDLSSDQRIIYPGDASKSQLHHRTASKNPNSMMPPLAKNEIDLQGVSLIEEWINQMEPISTLPVAGDYRIVNLGTGLTLQVSDGGLVDKSNVIVGSYNELESQHFALESTVTGHYGLRALHSGHYVDVSWANMSANANVWQYTGNGSDAQLWEIRSSGAGTFQMVSKLSGHFLGSQANGNVAVYPDNGSNAVLWRFVGLDEVQELEVTAIPDQSVVEGSSVTFTVAAHGGDVSLPIIYSASGLPEGVAISPESGVVSGAPEIGSSIGGPFSDGTYYVTVTATRGDEGSTVDFIWEVTSGTVAAPVDGEAVFRIKSAGPTQVSTDEGPDWLGGAPSGAYIGTGYSVNTGVSAPATGMIYDNRHSSIPSYIDAVTYEALFSNERWDGSGIPEMQYSIPLPNGDYTINLYLGNFCTCTDEIGERIFGIAIEGEEVRSALDLISEFGHLSGGMLSYPVTLTDGSLQIEFIHGTENPVVNAIEIRDNKNIVLPAYFNLLDISDQSVVEGSSVTFTVAAHGGDVSLPIIYSASGLPEGIAISPESGVVSGAPEIGSSIGGPFSDGTYYVTVTATRGDESSTVDFIWEVTSGTVAAPVDIIPISDLSVVEGSSVTFTVTAHGGDVSLPIIYSASGLPEGVTISPESGLVSGTPEIGSSIGGPFSDGTYYVAVTATRGDEGSTIDFIWEITPEINFPSTLPVAGDYRIVNLGTGLTLQVSDGGLVDKSNVIVGSYNELESQHFALESTVTGHYGLRALHSGHYVDVSWANMSANANVWQYTGNGSDAQLWEIRSSGAGTFQMVSKLSGHFLGSQANGNVAVYPDNGSNAVLWRFVGLDEVQELEVTAIPDQSVVEGSSVTFTVAAHGGDVSLPIIYSASGLPEGVAISPESGVVSGAPEIGSSIGGPFSDGTYYVTVTATRGDEGSTVDFIWEVTSGTVAAPVDIIPISDLSVVEGSSVTFTVTAHGGDVSLPIIYSASGLPEGVTISPESGLVSGTPEIGSSIGGPFSDGTYYVAVTATRGDEGSTIDFIWEITPEINFPSTLPVAGDYRIVNLGTGLTLQVSDGGLVDKSNVIVGSYNELESQHFALESTVTGHYGLRALHSGHYVDVSWANMSANANVWQYTGNGSDAQLWEIRSSGAGTFQMVSKLSGHFLGSQANGNVAVYPDNGSNAVLWRFVGLDEVQELEVTAIPDQSVVEGSSVTFTVAAHGGDVSLPIIYSASGLPEGVAISPESGVVSGAPEIGSSIGGPFSDGTYYVTVTATRGDEGSTVDFIWEVTSGTVAAPVDGEAVFRIKSAGPTQVSTDEGPDWLGGAPSGAYIGTGYSVNTGVSAPATGMIYDNRHSSIPSYIDAVTYEALFSNERWDGSGIPEMQYSIPLPNGDYTINLYLGNFCTCTDEIGERIFGIAIEGEEVRSALDLISEFGHLSGGMLSYPVTLTDGSLQIEFIHGTENPVVNAIEIRDNNKKTGIQLKSLYTIENNSIIHKITVYPNPVKISQNINVIVPSDFYGKMFRLEFYSVQGSKVLVSEKTVLENNNLKFKVDDGLASGVYIIRLFIDNILMKSQKVIIE